MKPETSDLGETVVDLNVDLLAVTPLAVRECLTPHGLNRLERSDGKQTLPGQPYVRLDGAELLPHLRSAHLTSELDRMAPYLWLITTGGHETISPLHHEETRGRTINITEYPGLHLVSYYGRIFVKPIPEYMLTQAFWTFIGEADADVYKAAMGFMRTYFFLIQHETDFRRAQETHLIPRVEGRPEMTFEEVAQFIQQFAFINNASVAPRYQYGTLRLTWLNDMTFFVLGRLSYFKTEGQWSEWFGRTFGPIIAVFAIISVILNTMQVGLSAAQINSALAPGNYPRVCWEVARFILIISAMISSASVLVLICVFLKARLCGLYMMNVRRKDKTQAAAMRKTVIR